MKLHILTIVIYYELIHIGNNGLYLIYIKEESVGRHEDEAIRQLLPAILMEFHYSGIKPRLVVTIERQMTLEAPVGKLINNMIEEFILHALKGAFLCILIGRTEGTVAVASVDCLKINYKRHRCFVWILKYIFYIFLLTLLSCCSLKLKI